MTGYPGGVRNAPVPRTLLSLSPLTITMPSSRRQAFPDLQSFVAELERTGRLRRITAEVDPYLEVSEIVQRVIRRNGPALLFERPSRGRFPWS